MSNPSPTRVQRTARLQWVPVAEMRVSTLAQRDRNDAKVSYLAAHFDPEEIGAPTVNLRDGHSRRRTAHPVTPTGAAAARSAPTPTGCAIELPGLRGGRGV